MKPTPRSDEPDDELLRLGLQFAAREHETIGRLVRKLCRRSPRGLRPQLEQAALDEARRVVPLAMRTYRVGSTATLRTHVLGWVRWYAWKAVRAEQERLEGPRRCASLDDVRHEPDRRRVNGVELDVLDRVQSIMDELPPAYAELLRWRFIEELSLDEIGELLGLARSGAHRYVQLALEAARRIAKE